MKEQVDAENLLEGERRDPAEGAVEQSAGGARIQTPSNCRGGLRRYQPALLGLTCICLVVGPSVAVDPLAGLCAWNALKFASETAGRHPKLSRDGPGAS